MADIEKLDLSMAGERCDDAVLPCPFCGSKNIAYGKYEHTAGRRYAIVCMNCMAQIDPGWAQSWGAVREMWNRRAQPENSRQHALQTGVCPMCEDCPDGCPVETPNDSRNRPDNEPLTLEYGFDITNADGSPIDYDALGQKYKDQLCYCDIDGFYIGEDGQLVLMDDCGSAVWVDRGDYHIEVRKPERSEG